MYVFHNCEVCCICYQFPTSIPKCLYRIPLLCNSNYYDSELLVLILYSIVGLEYILLLYIHIES